MDFFTQYNYLHAVAQELDIRTADSFLIGYHQDYDVISLISLLSYIYKAQPKLSTFQHPSGLNLLMILNP